MKYDIIRKKNATCNFCFTPDSVWHVNMGACDDCFAFFFKQFRAALNWPVPV